MPAGGSSAKTAETSRSRNQDTCGIVTDQYPETRRKHANLGVVLHGKTLRTVLLILGLLLLWTGGPACQSDGELTDADGDGVLSDQDCEDDDPTVFPGAIEDCNGRDDDCDDQVDEGLGDSDRDGLCDGLDSEDCDGLDNDGDSSVDEDFPDTDADGTADCLDSEDCDGADNDGDGVVDEGLSDSDNDGLCDELDSEDCDGLDNDGDGLTDENFLDTDDDGVADCVDSEDCDGTDIDGDGTIDEGYPDTDLDGLADCLDNED